MGVFLWEYKKLTDLEKKANWALFSFHTVEDLFASNHFKRKAGYPFNLIMINLDVQAWPKITNDGTFELSLSSHQRWQALGFSSNRNNAETRDTKSIVAEWIGLIRQI